MRIRGKYYVVNDDKYLYEILSEKFLEYLQDKIIVEQKEVVLLSYNSCAFFAYKKSTASEDDSHITDEIEVFELNNEKCETVHNDIAACLGDYCFAVFGQHEFVQVMVKHTRELGVVPDEHSKDFAVIKALEYAITRIYERQHIVIKTSGEANEQN
jgi:hypothetical protein